MVREGLQCGLSRGWHRHRYPGSGSGSRALRDEARAQDTVPHPWHHHYWPAITARYSCRTTLRREVFIYSPPLYLMKPIFLNLFMKKLTRERVVPIISASVS